MDEDTLKKLRERLNEVHRWPSKYMFKFVLPNEEEKVTQLKVIFGESAEFQHRLSANANYISITVFEVMLDADAIFERYTKAGTIPGIISL